MALPPSLFGTAPPALDPQKTAPLHKKFAKQSRSTKSRSTKTMYLRARFTKMVDLHKGCSTKQELVELEKITHHCHWLHRKMVCSFPPSSFLLPCEASTLSYHLARAYDASSNSAPVGVMIPGCVKAPSNQQAKQPTIQKMS